tara:strand:- start:746 stop:1156 length:411 start_codon:yes stop_codon:yes gene_type:complete
MIIDDSKLVRFINNDLSESERKKIKYLINNNKDVNLRVDSLKKFKSILKQEAEENKKIKMPKELYQKISNVNKIKKDKFNNNFYKIAAGFTAFITGSWLFISPNTALLSQNTSNYFNFLIIFLLILVIFLILNKKK